MSLTAQFFAGDTDKLWKTYSALGSHSGVPADGEAVQAWQDEATPATRDRLLKFSGTGEEPDFRYPGAMLDDCLDFDGTASRMKLTDNTGLLPKTLGDVFGAGAKTLIFSVRIQGGGTNNATIYTNTGLVAESASYFGVFLKTNAGVHTLQVYNWDGSSDVTTAITVSLDTDYVVMVRHDGTNLVMSVLSGDGGATRTDQSVASGNTSVTTGQVIVGCDAGSNFFSGCFGEIYFDNTDLGSTNTPLTDIVGRWLPNAGPTYTISIETGAFALTGNDSAMPASRKLSIATGAFSLTGNAVALPVARKIAIDTGVFLLTGSDITLSKQYQLQIETGAFALTGNDVSLRASRKLTFETGAFALTGNAIGLEYTGGGGGGEDSDASVEVASGTSVGIGIG